MSKTFDIVGSFDIGMLHNYTINYDPSPGGRETLKPFKQKKRAPAQFKYKRRAGESSEHVRILCLIFQTMTSGLLVFEHDFPADSIFKLGWDTS